MLKNKIHKKLLSIIASLAMVFGCITAGPTHANAEETTAPPSSIQIIKNDDGSYTGGEKSYENGKVKVSKTIEGTNTENVFDITLQVKTTEDLTTVQSSPDAATVLVLDRSGSMAYDAAGNEPNDRDYTDPSRFSSMQKAAIAFINGYANVEPNSDESIAERWIAIMSFSSDADQELDWYNVTSESGKTAAINAINTLDEPNGGTNIEAGLQLAYNNLNNFGKTDSTNGKSLPQNTNVILLTDGEPTFHIGEGTDKTSLTFIKGQRGGGSEAKRSDWNPIGGKILDSDLDTAKELDKADNEANTISAKIKGISNLFTVAFATSDNAKFSHNTNRGTGTVKMNPHRWMKTFATKALTAGNETELLNEFNKINEIIRLSAQAWEAIDPMGSNIEYKGVVGSDGHIIGKDVTTGPNVVHYNENNNEFNWNIKISDAETSTIDGKTVYTYTLKYRVVLDTTIEGASYENVATNGTTTLKYFLTEEFGSVDDPQDLLKDADFLVPSIKGLFGNISFTKVNENNEPMKNVFFTLTGESTGSNKSLTRTASSDENGNVSFTNIPAGNYTLTETATPTGYKAAGPWKVKVSYGTVTITEGTLGNTVHNYPINKQLTISKKWVNEKNEDITDTPNEIKVNILQNGNQFKVVTLNKENNWTTTIDVPWGNSENNPYAYTIEEEQLEINGYETLIDGFTITNKYKPDLLHLEGTKTWDTPDLDLGEQYPNIKVTLQRSLDGITWEDVETKTVITTEGKTVTYSFDNVVKTHTNGNDYQFRVKEDIVHGYNNDEIIYSEIIDEESGRLDITNTYTPGKTEVAVTKKWFNFDGTDLAEDIIKPMITVQLLQNNVVKDTWQLNNETGWSHTFKDLDKTAPTGKDYVYEVKEVMPEDINGYSSSTSGNANDGFIISNTLKDEKTKVNVTKVWENVDNNIIKPDITLHLYQDGTELEDKKVTLTNGNTTYTFENLPKYSTTGKAYVYTVSEDTVPGYETDYKYKNTGDITITNTYDSQLSDLTGIKTWDVPDEEKDRVPNITIHLQQKLKGQDDNQFKTVDTITVKNGDTHYTFKNIPTFDPTGIPYEYQVIEDKIPGYESTTSGLNLKNTYKPGTTSLTVEKEWKGITPNEDGSNVPPVIIQLYKNGQTLGSTIKLEPSNGYKYTFDDLEKYDVDGTEFIYTVDEIGIDDLPGYISDVNAGIITNTFDNTTFDIPVTKIWNNVPKGATTPDITVILYKDKEVYDTKTLTNLNNYTETFTDLKKYDSVDGHEYDYSIKEINVNGYTTSTRGNSEDGFTITNTYTGGDKVCISGTKTWSNPNEKHPTITINLLRNGIEIDDVSLTNGTTEYNFNNLYKYAPDGNEYTYKVTEDPVDGYTTTQDGYNFTNTFTPGTTSLIVRKEWKNTDKVEFEGYPEIKVQLKQDGENYGNPIEITKEKEWTVIFSNLPVYKTNGTKYNYTVSEIMNDDTVGYETPIISGGITSDSTHEFSYVITNTFNYLAKTSINGTKTWSNPTDEHPEVVIELYKDGKFTGKTTVIENDKYSFTDLQKYSTLGKEYVYTVKEKPVNGYTSIKNENNFHNTYTGKDVDGNLTKVVGKKVWAGEPETSVRPVITINLLQDGKEVDEVQLAKGKTSFVFDNLAVYAPDGHKYQYTVTEDAVNGYESDVQIQASLDLEQTITNVVVTNTYTGKDVDGNLTKVEGKKVWAGEPETSVRPVITINLLQDGKEIDEVQLAKGKTSFVFDNLAVYAPDGHKYQYTVTEDAVNGYESDVQIQASLDLEQTITNVVVTNTYTGKDVDGNLTKVEGKKVWVGEPETSVRPVITINLLQDGKEIDEVQLAKGKTSFVFDNLAVYAPDGHKYQYTVTEDAVNGYESDVQIQASLDLEQTITNVVVTNTYTGKDVDGNLTKVEGKKVWAGEPETSVRPVITINLLQDGKEIDEVQLAKGKTSFVFDNLAVYAPDGHKYQYTVTEDAVNGYESDVQIQASLDLEQTITNVVVTNTYTGKDIDGNLTKVVGKKVWAGEPETSVRPVITINLLQDGKEIDEVQLAKGKTSFVFDNLAVYAPDGHKYQYTVTEDAVNGYESDVQIQASLDLEQTITNVVVTNTYTGKDIDGNLTEVSGTKTWLNVDDGEVVPTITINLLQDNKEIDEVTLANGTTEYSFDNLPIYAPDGHKYLYDVTEDAIDGFDSTKDGFNFTNTKIIPLIPLEPSSPINNKIDTGDHSQIGLYTMISMISLAGIILFKRKKEIE